MAGRFAREVRAQAAVVETVIMLILLVAFFGGFSAYAVAAHARAVVIAAATAAARAASIECGEAAPAWQADAMQVAEASLKQGGLRLAGFQTALSQPGDWSVTFGGPCTNGSAVTATVRYAQLDLFPFVAPLVGAGRAASWSFILASTAVYPVD
jgi:hypothetical protein